MSWDLFVHWDALFFYFNIGFLTGNSFGGTGLLEVSIRRDFGGLKGLRSALG